MDEVTAILNDVRPGGDFSGAQNFFNEGILDSVDMATLVAALESRYDIFIDVDEIVDGNLNNLTAIKTMLARKGINLSGESSGSE